MAQHVLLSHECTCQVCLTLHVAAIYYKVDQLLEYKHSLFFFCFTIYSMFNIQYSIFFLQIIFNDQSNKNKDVSQQQCPVLVFLLRTNTCLQRPKI